MRFPVFLRKEAASGKVPALFRLAGPACTGENFSIEAGAQRQAAEHGIEPIAPDTSPRGAEIPGAGD